MSTDSSAAFTKDYGLAACTVSITTNPVGRHLPAAPAYGHFPGCSEGHEGRVAHKNLPGTFPK